MANKIKFYKVPTLPGNLTPTNDGFYFVKGTTDSKFRMYIVNAGIATEIDAITLATFTTGLATKFDKPTGTTLQYIRGDGTLAILNKSVVGLDNVDNTSDINKPISTATQNALDTKANDNSVVHIDGTENITGVKTFKATPLIENNPVSNLEATNKGYVDSKDTVLQNQINDLSAAIQQGMRTPIDIDCSTNPNYPVSAKGATYIVTAAGRIGGASGPEVEIGDMIICKETNSTAGTHAAVGANFFIVQTNLQQATETLAGFAKIATQLLTDNGSDDTTIVTPKKLAARLSTFISTNLDTRYLRYDASQTLTEVQQKQVQTNLNIPSKSEAVLVTGTQNIDGSKTFSTPPKSNNDASIANELVRLSQVQTLIQNAEITWTSEEWS